MVRVLGREQRSKVTSSVSETRVGAETEYSQHAEEAEETADITTLETEAATRGMEAETETDQVLGHTWHQPQPQLLFWHWWFGASMSPAAGARVAAGHAGAAVPGEPPRARLVHQTRGHVRRPAREVAPRPQPGTRQHCSLYTLCKVKYT